MRSYSFPLDRPPKYHAHTSPAQTRVLDSESALPSSYETESPKDMEPVITSAAFVTLTSAGGINVSEELVTDTRQVRFLTSSLEIIAQNSFSVRIAVR